MQQWSMRLPQTIQRDGTTYQIDVLGSERANGTWSGQLRFSDGSARPIVTEQETSQPNRESLEYWATGLEQVYLDGAIRRAERAAAKGRS